ncbi:MAG: hypothetical protein IKE14_05000 [Loktanella sp.]|nr:hypothetical protein [Loktanella sp.]
MNPKKKLGVIAAAIVVASQIGFASTAVAAPNAADARIVVQLLENADISGLRAYLEANPQAMVGDSALALALAGFYARTSRPNAFEAMRGFGAGEFHNVWLAASMY